MFLVLNIRNILDNFYKYGLIIQATPSNYIPYDTLAAIGSLFIFIVFAFLLEKMRFNKVLGASITVQLFLFQKFLITINWISILTLNLIYCHSYIPEPVPGVVFTALAIVLALKLISFQQVNSELYKILVKLEKQKKNDKKTDKKTNEDLFSEY